MTMKFNLKNRLNFRKIIYNGITIIKNKKRCKT